MPSRRWSAGGLLVVLLLAGCAVPAAATNQVASQAVDGSSGGATTEFVIALEDSGDAVVRVHERQTLATEAERAAFRTVAGRFEDGELTVGATAVVNASRAVERSVEREMSTTDIQRRSSLAGDNTTGTLTAEFRWENFARVEGSRLYLDGVFDTERGLWLPGLTRDQRLTISIPDGYGVRDASVSPDEGQLRWRGPTTFDSGTLDATFVGISDNGSDNGSNGTDPGGNGSNGGTTDGGPDESAGSDGGTGVLPWLVAGIAVAVAVAVVLARSDWRDRLAGPGDDDSPATEQPPAPESAGEASTEDQTGDELLSDEERVERLLEEQGGRVKQAEVVERTDWSDAKVSQVLSSMEEEGRVDKLRIGRENLITLPGVDPMDSDDGE